MDARAKTVREILYSGDQYLIPFFQRHYSWKLMHWQRLWDDLLVLADDPKPRQHFLGPLVCMPINHMPGEIPEYQLIDGQQRLTTLTLLLAALRDLAREHGLDDLADDIHETYLVHKRQRGLLRYKLIPRVGDREILIATIEGAAEDHSRRMGIIRAYKFLKASAEAYIQGAIENRLRTLMGAVTGRFSLVVITVEGENPYEIFESLNSTGLPLDESDLIRNYIFMQVPLSEQDEFNQQHWASFESMFESTEQNPESIDMTSFYRDYLMRNGEYSRMKQTFQGFKEQWRCKPDVTPIALVEELKKYAKFAQLLQRRIDDENTGLNKSLDRMEMLQVSTAHPLLMNLLARHATKDLTTEDLIDCMADLESFVIRRSICGESTRGYGEMFPAAIKELGANPRENLRSFLIKRGWPDDATFTERLLEFALYRREYWKCTLILQELERAFAHKEAPKFDELTVEHVLPQTIDEGKSGKDWREVLGENWEKDHEKWMHTIGNLTLTGYNPKLSNRPFGYKQELFAKSNVELNKYFADLDKWDVAAIRNRGKDLARKVAELWPAPKEASYVAANEATETDISDAGTVDGKSFREEYWEEFKKVLNSVASELVPDKEMTKRPRLLFAGPRSDTRFVVSFDTEEACVSVGVQLRWQQGPINLRVLRQDELAIEAELGQQVEWDDEASPAVAGLYLDSAQAANRADWTRQHQWLARNLKRFIEVVSPRLCAPEDENFNPKKTVSVFWQAFCNHLKATNSCIDLPSIREISSGREGWCENRLAAGVNLWLGVYPVDNCVGAGLEFEGKKGIEAYDRLLLSAKSVDVTPSTMEREEYDKARYIGAYRLAFLRDKSKWPEYFAWLRSTAEKSVALWSQGNRNEASNSLAAMKE
jgi:hypothetical protein